MRETPGGDIHFSSSKLSLKETSNWARIGHGALKEKEMKTCIYLIDKWILLMSFVNCLYCFGISEMQNLTNWENASLNLLLLKELHGLWKSLRLSFFICCLTAICVLLRRDQKKWMTKTETFIVLHLTIVVVVVVDVVAREQKKIQANAWKEFLKKSCTNGRRNITTIRSQKLELLRQIVG